MSFRVVDVIQGGGHFHEHDCPNEVIATGAIELPRRAMEDYGCLHSNEHIDIVQSTNDVYPSALKIAVSPNEPAPNRMWSRWRQRLDVARARCRRQACLLAGGFAA